MFHFVPVFLNHRVVRLSALVSSPECRCCSCVLGIIDAIAFAYIRCREFWALLLCHWSLNGRCVRPRGMGLLSVPASAPPMAAALDLVSNVGLVQEKVISSFLSDS